MKVKTFIAGNATEQIQLHPNLTCINHLQPEVEEPFDFSMYNSTTTQKLLTVEKRKKTECHHFSNAILPSWIKRVMIMKMMSSCVCLTVIKAG